MTWMVASGSVSLTRLQSMHSPWPVVSFQGSTGGETASKVTCVIVRIQFLSGSWPETSVPCLVYLSIRQLTSRYMAAGLLQSEQGRERERESERERECERV